MSPKMEGTKRPLFPWGLLIKPIRELASESKKKKIEETYNKV